MEEDLISIYCILDDYIKYFENIPSTKSRFSFTELCFFAQVSTQYFQGNISKTREFFVITKLCNFLPSREAINRKILKICPKFWVRLLNFLSRLERENRIHAFLSLLAALEEAIVVSFIKGRNQLVTAQAKSVFSMESRFTWLCLLKGCQLLFVFFQLQ